MAKIKIKKSLSSMDIAALVREFQPLIGAYIRKAYQPEREVVVLRLNTGEGRKDLVIRTGKALFLSSKGPENPPQPTGFAMLLRKHLTNGRIVSIEQQEFDRIMIFGIQKEEKYDLIVEGFGDGNIVLVKDGTIVQPLISKTWRHRTVRAGRDYEVPPAMSNPVTMARDQFDSILKSSDRDVVRTLAMAVNLGGIYAEEVCLKSGVEKNGSCGSLTEKERDLLWANIKGLFEKVNALEPGIVKQGEEYVNILPFRLEVFGEYEYQSMERFNGAVEEFFSRIMIGSGEGREEGGKDGLSPEVLRIQRTIEQQEETIVKLERSIREDKERAERLFLRYIEFEKVLNDIKGYGEKHGWREMAESLSDHPKVLEVNTAKKFIVLQDDPTNIRLEYLRSVNENAQRYYEAATRSREKMIGAKKALEESRIRLEKAKKHELKIRERTKTERKYFWFEKYRWFISSEGNIIVGGKDAYTNDRVVKKYLKERDRYAHADIHGAPSLVIKSMQNEEIGEQTLEETCIYAASFSRAWKAGIGGVEAYWVYPDQVSKTPAAGEFIAKGAFIVRGKRNRIHSPLKLGLGKILYGGVEMIMCGPISAVENYTNAYFVIEPGDIPKNDFAKRLSKLYNVKNEEILSILPGDVRISSKVGIDWNDE